jgi:hypothetical protein
MAVTEIEIEGVGIMRPLNDWQVVRIKAMSNRQNKAIAWTAFSLGMSLQQFKKLPQDKQREAHGAFQAMTAPNALTPATEQREAKSSQWPRRGEHVAIEDQIELGQRLLEIKATLPRGHFIPWVENEIGISYLQAQRWMKAAKHARTQC